MVKISRSLLGSGMYGTVTKGVLYHKDGPSLFHIRWKYEKVAIKIINLRFGTDHYAMREVHTLLECSHDNIVRCHGFGRLQSEREDLFIIVFERLPQTLAELIFEDQYFRRNATYGDLLDIFLGIVNGLMCMHEHRLIHFDLKPANILLADDRKTPKIIDFGHVSRFADGSICVSRPVGTPLYTAPEVHLQELEPEREQRVNKSVDTYSLGVTMWECIMRRRIYEPQPQSSNIPEPIAIHNRLEHVPFECNCEVELRELIRECVQFDGDTYRRNVDDENVASETYGRPALETVMERLEAMKNNEQLVNTTPPAWML